MKPDLTAAIIEFVLLLGLLLFSRGFLPPTRTKTGFATESAEVQPHFNRMVFMVVDAMRSDFMFSDKGNMPEVHRLLNDGKGYAYTAFSDPPTVTLPRLKGITTGASPNFLDAVINIAESDSASTLQHQDSWVHQLHVQNKTMHMLGDNTWLKLFPNTFSFEDGTDSFYVADFTEVDYNVTRNLDNELNRNTASWDVLILHYLGLDHIGHKGGPESAHMPGKQHEMDQIIRRIFDSLDDETLFVVLGDHGMNDVGNHGGASAGETSAALALFSKQFNNPMPAPVPFNADYTYYKRISQVDLVPTLSFLLGFPTPKNSLGVVIEDILSLWNTVDRNKILEFNCALLGVSSEQCNIPNLRETQSYLMRSSSEHILWYMYVGIVIIALACFSAIWKCYVLIKKHKPRGYLWIWWLVVPLLLFISMMGSSTVEEEHYFWYWILSGILCHAFVAYNVKAYLAITLLAYRILRGWNSTGQKWTSANDVGKFLGNHSSLSISLVGVTVFSLPLLSVVGKKFQLVNHTENGDSKTKKWRFLMGSVSTVGASIVVFLFKFRALNHSLNTPSMLVLARMAYALSASCCLLGEADIGLVLMLIMQTKLQNIPLWAFLYAARWSLSQVYNSTTDLATCSLIGLCFEFTSFFAFGGSNSLATIDLSNAYNGVSGYNIPLVALLTYLGNWAPSLYWSMIDLPAKTRILRSLILGTLCLGISIACLVLREHLFIWTVFSPKLLYVVSWLVFHELVVSLVASLIIR